MSDKPKGHHGNQIIGENAEQEVCYILEHCYGRRNVSYDVLYRDGVNGHPDIRLKISKGLFFVEVKSIVPFVRRYSKEGKLIGYRPNAVKVNRESWFRLIRNAKAKKASIVVIVQVRFQNRNENFLIGFNKVNEFVNNTNALWVHIPLWYVLNYSKITDFSENDFEYVDIEPKQDVLK